MIRILKLVMANGQQIIVDSPYNKDPLNRIIHKIERVAKNGEMAYIDWYQLKTENDEIIADVQSKYVEAVIYVNKL